jgi:MinD superfamily P-loop ATPase
MKKNIRQIVLVSGKGGTGKTTLAAALSSLFDKQVVADGDVDAADLHILLKPRVQNNYPYVGGKKAAINLEHCTRCGLCMEFCRFAAIENYRVDPLACEGCGFCFNICPEQAVTFSEVVSGYYRESIIPSGNFVDAELQPGEGNSGKLVSEVKKRAMAITTSEKTEWLIVDGPPGIGCPVNASLAGADLVLVITEPTVSGLHDLERVIQLIKRFRIPSGVVINKHNLNPAMCEKIERYTRNEGLFLFGKIPFDEAVVTALLARKIITEFPDNSAAREIVLIYGQIKNFFDAPIMKKDEVTMN